MTSAIQIRNTDTVATAVGDLAQGETVQITGARTGAEIAVAEAIPRGHKIALRDIAEGEHILKYGEVIGMATSDIAAGQWVHVHNCRGLKARRHE
jgi:altronate dehydratase